MTRDDQAPADATAPSDTSHLDDESSARRVAGSTLLMAAGTTFSRLSGFLRSALLVAALGGVLHADLFNLANTVPNMVYILVAGGIFNAVLVPQLVRAMTHDADGGNAYAQRLVTLAGLFLLVVTVVLVVAAPWVMQLFLDSDFDAPERQAHVDSVVAFARFCLPQVFFYGMFVLVGQVLNARGRFGPMMWAPIANNVISVAVLVVYLVVFGPARGAELVGPYTPGQELLLGLGSTAGIAVQFLVLLPYLRKAGFRYRPRFDFRDSGLGHTLRLGMWTVLFVVVNQIAYTVVVRLASSGTAADPEGTGYTVYSNAFLIVMVPHSIITVSLATAVLPRLSRLAADDRLADLGRTVGSTLRGALVVVAPFVVLLPVVASDVSRVIWGFGAGSENWQSFAPSLATFAPGLLFFTVHYVMLRGFYALEQTRTVFWIQVVVATTNVMLALVLVHGATPTQTAPRLVLAYVGAYAVGSLLSYAVLRRTTGDLGDAATVRFAVRMLVALLCTAAAAFGTAQLVGLLLDSDAWVSALLRGACAGVVGLVVFVLAARLTRITEVTTVLDRFAGPLRRRLQRR